MTGVVISAGAVVAVLVALALAARNAAWSSARPPTSELPPPALPPPALPPPALAPHPLPPLALPPPELPPLALPPLALAPHPLLPLHRLPHRIGSWLVQLSIGQWRAIDAETERAPHEAGRTSPHVLIILVTVAASLTLQEYLGGHDTYARLFPPDGSRYWELLSFAWWSGWRVAGYVGIPMLVLACLPGQRIRDYHVSPRGFFKHLWIYVALFAAVLPAVLYASTTEAFRETYPFYRIANRSYTDLALWELLYAAQFLSLEFFFRGFLLHGLRRALGANAIFVMLVPYCMIHYGKPLPETLGAIGAGLILGTLAMRTRSIWGGVLIHVGVATTMDVLALRGCPPFGGAPCH